MLNNTLITTKGVLIPKVNGELEIEYDEERSISFSLKDNKRIPFIECNSPLAGTKTKTAVNQEGEDEDKEPNEKIRSKTFAAEERDD